jgi:hypothetical protein
MRKYTFLMDYEIFDNEDISIKVGQMKVKNKTMEIEAKFALEDYLRKKYPSMHKLVVHKCQRLIPTFLGDIVDNDIFTDLLK